MPGVVVDSVNSAAMEFVAEVLKGKTGKEKTAAATRIVDDFVPSTTRLGLAQFESSLIERLNHPGSTKGDKEAVFIIIGAVLRKCWTDEDLLGTILLFPAIPHFLDALGDKQASLKEAAAYAMEGINSFVRDSTSDQDELMVEEFLVQFVNFLQQKNAKDQGVLVALKSLSQLVALALDEPEGILKKQMTRNLEAYFGAVENYVHHLKAAVSKQATKTLKDLTQLIDNEDIKKHIPKLIETLKEPTMKMMQTAIHDLCQTTFVQPVLTDLLALVAPILERTLNMPQMPQEYIRNTVVVVENLAKLVHNPIDAKQFLPRLLPGIDNAIERSALPEVRETASRSGAVVRKVLSHKSEDLTVWIIRDKLQAVLNGTVFVDAVYGTVWNDYVSAIAARSIKLAFESGAYDRVAKIIEDILLDLIRNKGEKNTAAEVGKKLQDDLVEKYAPKPIVEDEEEGIEVVNSVFSLAYGGMLLLNHTTMRLLKGHRYGICGKNGAGKSTLMRSIAEGKLEGFPTKEELRRCFVEFKQNSEDTVVTTKEYMIRELRDDGYEDIASDEASIVKTLKELGFDDDRLNQDVAALSGGWKMKLSLGKAILMKAEVLLLDEPTNHLDRGNVEWLQNYLMSHNDITSLIVSHDQGFLDTVCTDIINYEKKKLVYYKGNLSDFLAKNPTAAEFIAHEESAGQWNFPDPGILTGVKSNTKSIMKMTNVTFTYPGRPQPALNGATCAISLSSRIGIKGENGAGKSTLIKILLGELIPQQGAVEKHPNLRIGYVAQHSLKHVEMHLEKTPMQYLIWRYENGDDREANMKASRAYTEEDLIQMETTLEMNNGKGKGQIEAIVGRQKAKKSFQYEIKWRGLLPKFNTHIPREVLMENGFTKLVLEFDDKESAREGLGFRELKPEVIRKHFEDFGLDPDLAEHNEIGGMSGGQKVKIVFAAAMWPKPHAVILDEPTNYIDKVTLDGLAHAIKTFRGAVVMISHNADFMDSLVNEIWTVANQRVTTPKSAAASASKKGAEKEADTPADADDKMNFKAKAPKKKKYTRNQLKLKEEEYRKIYLQWLQDPTNKGTEPPKRDWLEE